MSAHRPRRRFGQHFLHDAGVVRRIVESLGQIEMRDSFMIQKLVNDWKSAQETLSNVLKAQHDTHKTLIQNARA